MNICDKMCIAMSTKLAEDNFGHLATGLLIFNLTSI